MKIPARKEIIESIKKNNRLIAAVFPFHYPKELFRAFNIHPIEVWGPPGIDTSKARAHLQTYICSIVQSGLSFYLSGALDVADMILVPHCCDSLQGLGSILKEFVNHNKPILTLYLPREKRIEDIEFLQKELTLLYEQLVKITGYRPNRYELLEAIYAQERIDRLILQAYDEHFKKKTDSFEFYTLMRSVEYLPLDVFEELLLNFGKKSGSQKSCTPIVLSGVLPEPMEVLHLIEQSGGFVADDDFACLRRRIYPQGSSDEPLYRMAERIVNAPPDNMMGASFEKRYSFLMKRVKNTQAKGVIFYSVKFCEPEKFYYPLLKEKLQKDGVRCLEIEVDINEPIPQQVKTRITAFIETIKEE